MFTITQSVFRIELYFKCAFSLLPSPFFPSWSPTIAHVLQHEEDLIFLHHTKTQVQLSCSVERNMYIFNELKGDARSFPIYFNISPFALVFALFNSMNVIEFYSLPVIS